MVVGVEQLDGEDGGSEKGKEGKGYGEGAGGKGEEEELEEGKPREEQRGDVAEVDGGEVEREVREEGQEAGLAGLKAGCGEANVGHRHGHPHHHLRQRLEIRPLLHLCRCTLGTGRVCRPMQAGKDGEQEMLCSP